MPHTVEIDTRAAREIRTLPKRERARIEALADNPRPPGCVKLSGPSGLWRIRCGVYRVIYHIRDDCLLVIVVRVAHRGRAYKDV